MPNVLVPIDVTYESITRRMVHSVVVQIMQRTGLSTKIPIRFYGALGRNYQPGSTIEEDQGEPNQFDTEPVVTVSVTEQYKEDAIINTPVRHQDAQYIFEDRALDILLKPIYSETAVSLEFSYRGRTRADVLRWRDDVKVRAGDGRQANLHELEYQYPVPGYALVVLYHLWSLREAVAGYGETFGEWLRAHMTKQATTLANFNGEKTLLTIKERQVGVQGWFDFTEPPQEERGEDGTNWTVNFTYNFTYQKAISTNFLYPLVVHNQLIDDRFYSQEKPYDPYDRPRYQGDVRFSYDTVAEMYRKPSDPLGGMRFPEFDEWTPECVPNATTSLINWLMQVEQPDPTMLLNLPDMGEWVFDEGFLDFLRQEYPYVSRRGQSFVTFTLFENLLPISEPCLVMDENLILRSSSPMDLRSVYHLRLGLITDYGLFTQRAIEAMENGGRTTLMLFQCLVNDLDVEYAETLLIGGKKVPLWYIEWFFGILRDRITGTAGGGISAGGGGPGAGLTGGYYIDWPLVGILTIIAKRKPDEEDK